MTQRATPVGRMEPVRGQISEAWAGKKIADIEAEHQEWADEQPTVQRCASCPRFRFEGTAADGRTAFQAHLLAAHPDRVKAKKRKRGMPGVYKLKRADRGDRADSAERADAMVEVRRRKRTTHA